MGEGQPVKLVLPRREYAKLFYVPIVQRTIIVELQGTHGVRDALDRIRLPMCIVVHRVNTPLTTGTMMVHVENSIHDRVSEIKVRRTHIDLRPQRSRAIWKLSLFHAHEQIEILFDQTVAIRAFPARFGQRAAIFANLVSAEIAYVSFAILNQLNRPVIQLLEVIRGIAETVPLEAQPLHVLHDGVNVFCFFFRRISIVETQIALAAKLGRQSEIEAYGFGVTDVQVTVWFRGKSGLYTAFMFATFKVLDNDVSNKIRRPIISWLRFCRSLSRF